jgi:hypothetical protein
MLEFYPLLAFCPLLHDLARVYKVRFAHRSAVMQQPSPFQIQPGHVGRHVHAPPVLSAPVQSSVGNLFGKVFHSAFAIQVARELYPIAIFSCRRLDGSARFALTNAIESYMSE